jgi:hypothetical protein
MRQLWSAIVVLTRPGISQGFIVRVLGHFAGRIWGHVLDTHLSGSNLRQISFPLQSHLPRLLLIGRNFGDGIRRSAQLSGAAPDHRAIIGTFTP